jgi:uncharacterized protein (DUF58 family)
VRESEEDTGRSVVVVLNHQDAAGATAADDEAPFENAVSLAASIAVTLLRQGMLIGLATADSYLPPAAGSAQATHILRCLALVERRPTATALPTSARRFTTIHANPGATLPRFELPAGEKGRRAL